MKSLLVLVFVASSVMAGSVCYPANILPNPGFESWIDTLGVSMPLPWITTAFVDPGSAYRSTKAHGGSYSLALGNTDSITGLATTAVLIQGGTHYDFSMYYSVSGFTSAGFLVLVESDPDSNLVEHMQMLSYTPGWSQISMGFDAHPSAVLLTAAMTSLSETLFFDDGVLDGLPGTGIGEDLAEGALRDPLFLTASPEPCRRSARIVAWSGKAGYGRLEIFDVTGRLVKRFDDGQGSGTFVWDLSDMNSRPVPSGTYFVVFSTTSSSVSRRITVLR